MSTNQIDIMTAAQRWAGRLNLSSTQQVTAVKLALAPTPPAVTYGDHTDVVRCGVKLMRAPRSERRRRGRIILDWLMHVDADTLPRGRRDRAAALAHRRRWARANVAVLHRLARQVS